MSVLPSPVKSPGVMTSVAAPNCPARTTPSLGKLQQGQEVTVIGRNSDSTWVQIERPDGAGTGWVSAEFVTISGDVNSLPVTSGENAAPSATETPTG